MDYEDQARNEKERVSWAVRSCVHSNVQQNQPIAMQWQLLSFSVHCTVALNCITLPCVHHCITYNTLYALKCNFPITMQWQLFSELIFSCLEPCFCYLALHSMCCLALLCIVLCVVRRQLSNGFLRGSCALNSNTIA